MNRITITPGPISGRVCVPSSKSLAHRAVICGALAKGASSIYNVDFSDDIIATINAVSAIGSKIAVDNKNVKIESNDINIKAKIDCIESGSTLRFMLPVAAALGINAEFTGQGRLPLRPIKVLTDILRSHSVDCSDDKLPLIISGKLTGGEFTIPGNISSQFISGLMLALPLTNEDCNIILSTPLESKGYVDLTIDVMSDFGVKVEQTKVGYFIKGAQEYRTKAHTVEGDWSQAAFFMSAAAIDGDIIIEGLNPHSKQGDMAAVEIFKEFGADICFESASLHIKKNKLKGITVDGSDIPDMIPAIAVTAAFADGVTKIHSASRLRLKESDRLHEVAKGLIAMGVEVTETEDGLIINGTSPHGAAIDGANDHRIVMAFSIAALYAKGNSTINGYNAINKSYPDFYKDLSKLGGKINVI